MYYMLKKRKAQGLPITIIVVAVVALLVIVVLIAVFSGRMGQFGQNIDALKQGTCAGVCTGLGKQSTTIADSDASVCGDQPDERKISGDFSDVDDNFFCCCFGD